MPVTNIRGVNINWQVIGETGPWIMLTTGGRRGHDEFIPLAERLAALGHRVVLHDRRNTGASDVLIEGAESEEVIWTEDMYVLMQKLGGTARLLRRQFIRRAHLDPVCPPASRGGARSAPDAHYWRRLCRRTVAR